MKLPRHERRRREAFKYFCQLRSRHYRHDFAIKKAAEKYFYSNATMEVIVVRQRRRMREEAVPES